MFYLILEKNFYIDINECGTGNGGCEQLCNNSLGGYLCTCRKGYERKPNDMYGCQSRCTHFNLFFLNLLKDLT